MSGSGSGTGGGGSKRTIQHYLTEDNDENNNVESIQMKMEESMTETNNWIQLQEYRKIQSRLDLITGISEGL